MKEDGKLWSWVTNRSVRLSRDEWYREDTFPHILGKYHNCRRNQLNGSLHSRTGTPYNVQDPGYVRNQNFSAEFQFDFWENYEKMIRNGYQGDFEGEDNNKLPLEDTAENVDLRRRWCMQSFLDLDWEGNIVKVDSADVEWYCRMPTHENRIWYDDEGLVQE